MAKGITIPAIVDAGFSVLAERGLEGLTMRLVADQLGVKAPAIYWHLASKAELFDEMATQMWREIYAGADLAGAVDVADGLMEFAHVVRATVLRYRDGAKLFAGTFLTDVDLLRRQEGGLAMMLAQGFDVRSAAQATSLVYAFTIGFTIEEQSVTQILTGGDARYLLDVRDRRLDAERFPLTSQAGGVLFLDHDARFAELLAVTVKAAMSLR